MTVAGRLTLPSAEPAINSSGDLSVGATLTVYLTGTDTLATLYADQALTTAISNPQTSNSDGFFYAQSTSIFADSSQNYDVELQLPTGELYQYSALSLVAPPASASGYAPINSPTFTGNPQAPTPAANNNSASIATTAFVATALSAYAPLVSPDFSGTPTVPTAAVGTDTTQAASTAFVIAQIAAGSEGATEIVASAHVTITSGTLTIAGNNGFSSITRSSAGAINYTFSTARPDTNYRLAANVENTTQLAAVAPLGNKTIAGFSLSVLTQNNIPTDPAGLSVTVFE